MGVERAKPDRRRVDAKKADGPTADVGQEVELGQPTALSMLAMQRLAGNRAVARLIVQRLKLNDGPSEDVGLLQQQLNATAGGARLAITGRFDAATEAAVKAFQGSNGLTVTGETDAKTQAKLDTLAPVVVRGGQKTVEHGAANVHGTTFAGWEGTHKVSPDKKAGGHDLARGAATNLPQAVTELQERLNGSATMSAAKRKTYGADLKDLLKLDGIFGPKTEAAVKQFQTDNGIKSTGITDVATWDALVTKGGPATSGHTEFEWREKVEGVDNVGGRARYDWKLTPGRLLISADINFIPMAKGVQGRINDWLAEIKEIWSTFKAVNKAKPHLGEVNVDFQANQVANGPVQVKVWKDAKRSDAANWHTEDRRRGLAAHEFGHLIGLADEYNRDEGQYLATTAQEPAVGAPAGKPADADQLANDIKAKMPLTDDGTILAGIITAKLGGRQGGFSRYVAKRYSELHGSDLVADITAAFATKGFTGFHGPKSNAISPFLYSSGSIMGTMTTAAVKGHDHPVEPRHIQPFVDIITRERTLEKGVKDEWEAKAR